ncbi:hypothetical protein ACOSQ2_011869 [Xanthoceras sorbifolium]
MPLESDLFIASRDLILVCIRSRKQNFRFKCDYLLLPVSLKVKRENNWSMLASSANYFAAAFQPSSSSDQ